jgi:flagellar assembly protein FliH
LSSVLKAPTPGTGAAARVFDLRPIEERAQEILASARRTLAEARAEADRLREAARAEGRELGRLDGLELGRREGLAQGLAAADQLRLTLSHVLRELELHRRQLEADAEQHLVHLAVRIAERVVKAHVRVDPETVRRNVAAAAELVAAGDRVQLVLAPSEVETVQGFLPDLAGAFQAAAHLSLVADERLQPGGCLLRTAGGLVDAQIQTQLEEIERQLTDQDALQTPSSSMGDGAHKPLMGAPPSAPISDTWVAPAGRDGEVEPPPVSGVQDTEPKS